MPKRLDVTNERYGKLVALRFVKTDASKRTLWEFKCDCGNTIIKRLGDVRTGDTKSCGCLHRKTLSEEGSMHKKINPRTYQAWNDMKQRCLNPNRTNFKNYGLRGITVCERWINSYENFVNDMGEAPLNYSLERVNNDGNYNPDNCKWATRSEQNHNKRLRSDNNSGLRGIHQRKSGKWRVNIKHLGKVIYNKTFDTIEQAAIARNEFIISNNLPHQLNQL